ncbi:MAG: DinB family protein [Acidobacteriota bacterium]|jgi:uncharacterized damage-inducible protein DinB
MNPEAARTAAQIYVRDFESEVPTTLKVLRSIPETNMGYRPDDKSRSGLGLCRHITLEDPWLLDGVASGSYKPVPDDSDACCLMTPAQCAERYEKEMRKALERVATLSGEALVREVPLFTYNMPAIAYLSMALRHSVHHRGQLSSYVRAMGGRVPGIYGPSADTPPA